MMRTRNVAAALAAVSAVGLSLSARADAPLIFCNGGRCGGDGPAAYAYRVDSGSFPMMTFQVGTNDLEPRNYTHVLTPAGWRFAIEQAGMGHDHGGFTMHGRASPGPCRCLTQGRAMWWTDDPQYAVEFFTFGFDHAWRGEDVSWNLTCRRPGPPPEEFRFHEAWDAPVGGGGGPVHGPSVAAGEELEITKARCKVRHGQGKKAVVLAVRAGNRAEHLCTLDTGQALIERSSEDGRIKFTFRRETAPPCGPNGATIGDQRRGFDCGC